MMGLKVKHRPNGAIASVGRAGRPVVSSATGGRIDIVTGASEPGYNPVDLLYASLASCLALSARIAASRLSLLDRFVGVVVSVSGEKTEEEPMRVVRMSVHIAVEGNLTEAERAGIVHMAEEICTVSNTLKTSPSMMLSFD
ncbi:MAG: OsmC family protein [Neorhizobium sp.]|nr:OsmC family protein [Neorhizobium sp.]